MKAHETVRHFSPRCITAFAGMIGLASLLSAAPDETPQKPEEAFRGGKVEWARLQHAGEFWNRHAQSDDAVLSFIRANTTLDIEAGGQSAPASDLAAMVEFPFLFVDTLTYLSPAEQRNLGEHLRRGGFILIDPCRNLHINPDFDIFLRDNLHILKSLFPDLQVEELPADHEVYTIYFEMGARPPQVQSYERDAPTDPLRLLRAEGRVIGILSLSGLQCRWSGVGHDPTPAAQMVTNIYLYAITR